MTSNQVSIDELISQLENSKEMLKQRLKEIDNELQQLQIQLNPLLSRKAELLEERGKVSKLLSLFDNVQTSTVTTKNYRGQQLEQQILELLQNSDGLSILEIARTVGAPASTVYHACNRLLMAGKITKNGSKYKLA